MTVQKDVTKNIYVGNGSTRTFPFTFECPAEHPEYIKVYLMQDDGTALATSDYQLDMDARQITYPSSGTALPEGKKLVIMRELPLQQMMNLVNNGPYFAEDVELAFDENVMAMQQIAEKLNRSIIMSVDIDGDAFVNEVPFEPGKSFRIADDGKSIVLTEDPARVLPLAENTYAQAKAQAQSAYASAVAAAKSEDSAAASASKAGNSAQAASTSAASAAESARLVEGYKDVAETAKSDASLYADNAKTSADNATANKEVAQSAANSASNFATDARSSANEAKSYRDASSTYATNAKNYSENVNVFIPSVSSDGVLSWTNKAGLANPPAVNIGNGGSNVTVDNTLSDSSANPVQNKVIKAALDNRAVLDDVNTFTSPNNFDIIYMKDGIGSLRWYSESPSFVIGSINSKNYTGNAATATKATKDSEGNVITNTYSKKADFDKVIKDLDVAFQEKVDKRDLADVATSGSYKDLSNKPAYVVQSVNNVRPDENGNVSISVSGGGSNVTVDTTLSATSTNAIANKTVYAALNNKLDKTAAVYEATKATQDGYGNVIASTYARKIDLASYVKTINNIAPDSNGNVTITVSGGTDITVDDTLSSTSTNAIQNKAVYAALSNKLGKSDVAVGAQRALQDGDGNTISSTYIKFINGNSPDTNGNVNVSASGGGVNTDTAYTWAAEQNFQRLKFSFEKFATSRISGTYDSPATSVATYNVSGNLTLDMSTLVGMISNGDTSIFTAYIASNGSYALSITNAGTLKYAGSAADLAITASGLLLNVFLTKNSSGVVTSIAQATKLS